MTTYVALLRGITPSNPNMRNERLRGMFERLGFTSVRTVISSGNVVFEAPSCSASAREGRIERELPRRLGFESTTIIRSKAQLRWLVNLNPFGGIEEDPRFQANVTFLKRRPRVKLRFPYRAEDGSFELLGLHGNAVCSVSDLELSQTDAGGWLARIYGREITTRSWRTVGRILRVMSDDS